MRAWPIPRRERTFHLVGDTQAITDARKAIVLADLARPAVPDVAYRFQVGDLVGGAGNPASFPAAIDFLDAMGTGQWWACVGNHDYDTTDRIPSPADAAASMGMPGVNFVVDTGFMVALFTYVRAEEIWDPAPYDPTWLDAQLAAYADRTCVVVAHPPLESAPDEAALNAVLLDHPQAKAWLCGHSHFPVTSEHIAKALDIGGRTIAQIDASATHYTIPAVDWTDRLCTTYVTVEDDRLEVRWRDHGAHQWVGGSHLRDRVWTYAF